MRRLFIVIVFSLILCDTFITIAQDDDGLFCKSLIAFTAYSASHTGYFLLDPNTGETEQIMDDYLMGLPEFTSVDWSSNGSQLLVTAYDPVVEGNFSFG